MTPVDHLTPGRPARWRPVAAVAVVILVASVVDPGSLPPVGSASSTPAGPLPDTTLHVVAYATLACTIVYATAGARTSAGRRVAAAFVGATAYGLVVELLQVPLPYRELSHLDVLADGLGAALGVVWLALGSLVRYRSDVAPES